MKVKTGSYQDALNVMRMIDKIYISDLEWYKKFYDDPYNNMLKFSISQIEEYYDLAKVRQMCWVK